MEAMKWLPLLILSLALARGEEIVFEQPAKKAELAFPIGNGELRAKVKGRTGIEPMAIYPAGGKHPATTAVPGNAFCGPAWFHFSLEWLGDKDKPVTDYKRTLNLTDGTVVTTFNRGGAGFTWTTFASREDKMIVNHLRTDKPGALSFRVTLPTEHDSKLRVEDRRILILNGKSAGKPFEARAWVYPMESEVTPGENEITVRGEGEAIILLAASRDTEEIKALPERLKPLGFGGDEHPDVFQVWHGLLERHKAAHAKAMEGTDGKAAAFSRYLKLAVAKTADLAPLPEGEIELPPDNPEDLPPADEILPNKR